MQMKYTYIVAFKIDGVSFPEGKSDIILNDDGSEKVILCSSTNNYSLNSDRGMAVGTMMLKGLVGQGGEGEFEDRVASEIKSIIHERNEKFPNGPFLLFEFTGETEVDRSKTTRDCGEFSITFDALDKEPIKSACKTSINHYLTSLFMVADRDYIVTKAFDGFHLEENGKITYSYTFSSSARVLVSNALTDEAEEKLRSYISLLQKTKGLDDVCRLLVRSGSEKNDKIRAFIFAWTALEVFFNKAFRAYEHKFLEKHTIDSLPILAQHFFERIRDVMKGKYSLRDKFIVIATVLSPDSDGDLEIFRKAKKARDTFLHGEDIDENELPTSEIVNMVKKYLKLHIEAEQP